MTTSSNLQEFGLRNKISLLIISLLWYLLYITVYLKLPYASNT